MNLHAVVRTAIQTVHRDEPCYLIQAQGQINVKGKIYPYYRKPEKIMAQIQPAGENVLQQMANVSAMGNDMEAFLFSREHYPVDGVTRNPLQRGGDFLRREDGTYWLITGVIEDWTKEGWANVTITEQTTPPDFSMCDWSEGE